MTSYDIAFHAAVTEAAYNGLLMQIVRSFAPLMQTVVPQAWQTRSAQEKRDSIVHRTAGIERVVRPDHRLFAPFAVVEHIPDVPDEPAPQKFGRIGRNAGRPGP